MYILLGPAKESENEYKVGILRNSNIGSSKLITSIEWAFTLPRKYTFWNNKNIEVKVLVDYQVTSPGQRSFKIVRGMNGNWDIDRDLTRSVFGLTQEELNNFSGYL